MEQAPTQRNLEILHSGQPSTVRQTDRFALLTLPREIGSSPKAAEATLRSLGARISNEESRQRLFGLAERSAQIHSWAKAEALEKLLKTILHDPTDKVITFPHFRRTLEKLAELLQKIGVDFVQYHGGMDMPPRIRPSRISRAARMFCFLPKQRAKDATCNFAAR